MSTLQFNLFHLILTSSFKLRSRLNPGTFIVFEFDHIHDTLNARVVSDLIASTQLFVLD